MIFFSCVIHILASGFSGFGGMDGGLQQQFDSMLSHVSFLPGSCLPASLTAPSLVSSEPISSSNVTTSRSNVCYSLCLQSDAGLI